MIEQRSNWAGNYTYNATKYHYPETIEQVQELVSRARQIKVLGSGHSFNDIADSTEDMLSLANFNYAPVIDQERHTLTVGAGLKYGQICQQLQEAGYALPNLASLPHISIAGACATATHGSGEGNGNLATAVAAIELVRADGSLVILSREENGPEFLGAVVGLGGLGVVTKVTLNLVPSFLMRQFVYDNLAMAQAVEHFDEIEAQAYSVSLFTDWQSDEISQVWLKHRVETGDNTSFEPKPQLFGATLAPVQRHPIAAMSAAACTPQMGIVGPWHARLPHFRMDFTPSSGEELQTEYLVPRRQAVAALQAVARLRHRIAPLLQICEVRTIAADDLWMSPCYGQARVALHFTWKKNWEEVRKLLPVIEEHLAASEAVPHWGKLFTMSANQVQAGYPRLRDFQRLLGAYDPQGKFRNAFLNTYVYS